MFTQDPISDIRLKNPPLISSAVFADIYSRCSALSLAAKASCFWNPLVVWLPLQGQNFNSYPYLLTFWYATARRNSGTTFPPRTARVMGLQLLTRLRSFFNLTSFRDFTRPSRSFARLLSAVFICSPWAQFPAKYVPVDWWITHPNHRCGEMVKSLMLVYRSFLGL